MVGGVKKNYLEGSKVVRISQVEYLRDRKKVFEILKNNPSASVQEIAKNLGFSVSKVYKIKREYTVLEQRNILFFPSFDQGLRHFIILIKTSSAIRNNSDLMDDTHLDIRQVDHTKVYVNFSYVAHGTSDLVFGLSSLDVANIKIFCNRIKSMFHDIVADLKIIEILKPYRMIDETNTTNINV